MFKFCLFLFIISHIQFIKSEKLIFVALHSRHGSRAPLNCDENTIDYLGEKWTNPGELTSIGQRMEYILGLRNRQRYITGKYQFLSDKFDPHEILVYSTDVNRTMLSITSQLQGLYPMYSKAGNILTEEQLKMSNPPVNISYEEIKKEIENLNNSALPNYMSVIPIHITKASERKMNVPDSKGCNDKVNKTRDNNKVTKTIIINASKQFNTKYSKNLHNYYDKNPENFTYDFDWIGLFCDTLVSDYSDGRKMEDFFTRTGINKDELLNDCWEIIKINFRDDFYGDDKNEVILLGGSTLIREILHYMKLRIDEDIKSEKEEINVSDFSKPKMLIYSGHDSTLTAGEMFMIKFFDLKVEDFIYPTYTTQLSFEVTRDEKRPEKLDYSNYKVTFYFNDQVLVTKNFDEFKKKVEDNALTPQQINEYCDGKIEEKSNNGQVYAVIFLGCLSFVFLIIIIILVLQIKIIKNNNESNNKNNGLINDGEN
jgi:hypothetical protein